MYQLISVILCVSVAMANPYGPLLSGSVSSAGYSAAVLLNTPTFYYRLADTGAPNAVDSSGNSHTGTYTTSGGGSITYSVTPGGVTGNNAVTFTPGAGTAYVDTGFSTDPGSSDFSLECWVKISNANAGTYVAIGKNNAGAESFWLGVGSGKANFSCNNALNGAKTAISATTVNDNNWHYLVGVRDGTTLRIYVDGNADGTAAFTNGGSLSPGGNFMVSKFGASLGFYFPGSLDEACYYALKLSPTDISNHYAARTAP